MTEIPRGGEECSLPDDLSWLQDAMSWGDLTEEQQKQIIQSQRIEEYFEEEPEVPETLVSELIGLLNDYGIPDAASIDEVMIRREISLEYAQKPEKIEEALSRARDRKDLASPIQEMESPSVLKLDDLTRELELMRHEEDYKKEIRKDIELLVNMGVDPYELERMYKFGKEEHVLLHRVAEELRGPLCEDIANFRTKKFFKSRQKENVEYIEFGQVLVSVMARRSKIEGELSMFLSADEDALRKAINWITEMRRTEEGRQRLNSAVQEIVDPEGITNLLMTLLATQRKMYEEAIDDFFEPDDAGWEEAP
jgi:hypothetical protein